MAEIDHLTEIKEQYNQEFDIKKTLESKANNITTISGTVAGLFFGLGQFLRPVNTNKLRSFGLHHSSFHSRHCR